MADRQKFCIIIMSIFILLSGSYLGYYIFIDQDKILIQFFNHIRLYIFFGQHIVTLIMLLTLLKQQENYHIIKWMFQLSFIIIFTFVGGQIFTGVKGGKVFGSHLVITGNITDNYQAILEFQQNQITLYFQIMIDFIMFFIVSTIAMIVLRCRDANTQESYQFMIDNLKSQEYVEEQHNGQIRQKKSCAICLADLQSQRVLKLPCQHIFHKECLVNWLKRSTVCPLCRTDIQQSLAPNSPQRLYPPRQVINRAPQSNRPIILPPPQAPPRLLISNQSQPMIRPFVSLPRSSVSISDRSRVSDHIIEPLNNNHSIYQPHTTFMTGNRGTRNVTNKVNSRIQYERKERNQCQVMRQNIGPFNIQPVVINKQMSRLIINDRNEINRVIQTDRLNRCQLKQQYRQQIHHPSNPLIYNIDKGNLNNNNLNNNNLNRIDVIQQKGIRSVHEYNDPLSIGSNNSIGQQLHNYNNFNNLYNNNNYNYINVINSDNANYRINQYMNVNSGQRDVFEKRTIQQIMSKVKQYDMKQEKNNFNNRDINYDDDSLNNNKKNNLNNNNKNNFSNNIILQ